MSLSVKDIVDAFPFAYVVEGMRGVILKDTEENVNEGKIMVVSEG